MKFSPSRHSKKCNAVLGIASAIHITSGVAVIVFQIILIQAISPYHEIGGGLWSGPVFFIQGVLGFVCLCDNMICSVVSFLISSVISALLTVALTAVAAVDLGSMYKCPKDDYRLAYSPKYCGPYFASRIIQAGWGIVIVSIIELIASSCSVFICIRLIYKKESNLESAQSAPYLYDEIPSPSQTRFRGSLSTAQEKVQTFRKSSYSLNSTLPVRRSRSVDRFSDSTDSYSDQNMMTSTHSVNIVPSGARSKKKSIKGPRVKSQSVYSMINPPGRPVPINSRAPSTRSLNQPGCMKHTAV